MKNVEINVNQLTSNMTFMKLFMHFLSVMKFKTEELRTTKTTSVENTQSTQIIYLEILQNLGKENEIDGNISKTVEVLKKALLDQLNEGVFDSILSYLIPKDFISSHLKLSNFEIDTANKHKMKRKDKIKNLQTEKVLENEKEVEIHVFDEVKGFKKDFKCKKSLLISNMKYFLEITKGQKLEEMDISIHCDVTIFEWLMKWMKTHSNSKFNEMPPVLDYKNVVPIMMSADFLQMKILLQDCLYYCNTNLNDIIKYSPNLIYLSDHILKRLANKLTNTEVQRLKDKNDKIKSRLFCKLIMSLNERIPEKKQGHYASLAYLYICLNCGKLITSSSASYVPCHIQYITVKYNCDIVFHHLRDPKWNINEHIKNIWTEYKSWSSTYWRLWSQCHFLYCCMCCAMYAVAFTDFCPYHPQQPHFYPIEQYQTTSFPIGKYPCCGSKAIKYETILMPSGCKLRSHTPKLRTNDDTCIQKIIDLFPDLIKLKHADDNVTTISESYNLVNFEMLSKNIFVSKEEWRADCGLLYGSLFNSSMESIRKSLTPSAWESNNEETNINLEEEYQKFDNCSSIGESENSETSFIYETETSHTKHNELAFTRTPTQTKSEKNEIKCIWSTNYSVRHNQDNQREYEEIAFQTLSENLLKKNLFEKKIEHNNIIKKMNYFSGGAYAEIESEWKEVLKLKFGINKQKYS